MRNGRNRKIRLKRLSSGGSPSKWIAQDILKRTGSDGVTSLPVSFQRANACVRGGKRIPVLAYAQKFLGISGKRPSCVKGHRFLTHQRLKTLVFRRIFCSPNRRCLPVEQRRVNPQRGISRERFAGKRPCRRKLAWQTCQNWRNSAASLPKTCTWSA